MAAVESSRSDTGGRGQPSTSHTGNGAPELLAEELGVIARRLQHVDEPAAMLSEIVAAAVALVPGVDAGSISVVTGRRHVGSQAPTSDLAVDVDALQEETGQGPCLDAAYVHQTVRVDDMSREDRWPLFAQRATEVGAVSMLSIQLYVEGDNLGALNLYGRAPYAFTDESEDIGLLFAAHAAVAYAGVRKTAQLTNGLASRDIIGQAKGILMERYHITAERAFLILTRISQDSNRKLHDVASGIASTGAVPQPPTSQRR
jgi:hypothetical protein